MHKCVGYMTSDLCSIRKEEVYRARKYNPINFHLRKNVNYSIVGIIYSIPMDEEFDGW